MMQQTSPTPWRQLVCQDLWKLVHDSRPMARAMSVLVCLFRASCCGSFHQVPRLLPISYRRADMIYSCSTCGFGNSQFWGFFYHTVVSGVSTYYPPALWLVGMSLKPQLHIHVPRFVPMWPILWNRDASGSIKQKIQKLLRCLYNLLRFMTVLLWCYYSCATT